MPRLTARELAEARRARADALHMLARLHHPAGYEVRRLAGLFGHIERERRIIAAPKPRTRNALYVNLYLIGLANSAEAHLTRDSAMAAVAFARKTMENGGIEPPPHLKFTHDWNTVWAP